MNPTNPKTAAETVLGQNRSDSIEEALSQQTNRAFDPDAEPIGNEGARQQTLGYDPYKERQTILSGHPAEEASLEPGEEGPESARFGSHREAEEKLTEQEQAVGRLAADLEETKSLLLRALANQSGQPADQPASKTIPPEEDFVKKRRREAMDEMEALDPDEENYLDQVASAQARADKDIHDHSMTEFMGDVAREQERSDTELTVRTQIDQAMKDEGLSMNPSSGDYALFMHFSNDFEGGTGGNVVDKKTGRSFSVSEAIRKTAQLASEYKGRPTTEEREPEPNTEFSKPMSLRDVVGNINANRRA